VRAWTATWGGKRDDKEVKAAKNEAASHVRKGRKGVGFCRSGRERVGKGRRLDLKRKGKSPYEQGKRED